MPHISSTVPNTQLIRLAQVPFKMRDLPSGRLLAARHPFLIPALLCVVLLWVYRPLQDGDFTRSYDDREYVLENEHVNSGLTWRNIAWAFTSFHQANWHPLTWISHMVDWHLYGPAAGGHHLTNIVLHMVNTVLVFFLFHTMTRTVWRSAVIAALFALHPMHVESVAWISERKDLLSGFFGLSCMISYVQCSRGATRRRPVLPLLFFAMGLMCKPMLVTLPCLLLLLDWWPLSRWTAGSGPESSAQDTGKKPAHQAEGKEAAHGLTRTLLLEKLPFFLLSTASSVVTFLAQRAGNAVGSGTEYPVTIRLSNASVAYWGYVRKAFLPLDLSPFYPHEGMPQAMPLVLSLLFLFGVTATVLTWRHRFPWFPVGWLWFAGSLVPVIGVVQVGLQGMADRYTYLPYLGLSIIVVWGTYELVASSRTARLVLATGWILLLGVLSLLSRVQAEYWLDDIRLFTHAVDVDPENYMAHINLGNRFLATGDLDASIEHSLAANRIWPSSLAYHNLGNALSKKGLGDSALVAYERSLEIRPDYADAHMNLGNLYARQGDTVGAIDEFGRTLQIDPGYWQAHLNLGLIHIARRETGKALRSFSSAKGLSPSSIPVLVNKARTHLMEGELDSAGADLAAIAALSDSDPHVMAYLGGILERFGACDMAGKYYRRALALQPESADHAAALTRVTTCCNEKSQQDSVLP